MHFWLSVSVMSEVSVLLEDPLGNHGNSDNQAGLMALSHSVMLQSIPYIKQLLGGVVVTSQ